MSYVHRMPHLSTARVHLLVALSIVAVLSFSLGLAATPLRHRLGLLASGSQPVAVAPVAPAITGARYDDGWAGGPGTGYQPASVGDQRNTPWTACSACYEQGWAGGPGQGYQPPKAPR